MNDGDSLSVSCPSCSKKLIAPVKAIGKMARCTKCNCRFEVNDPNSQVHMSASDRKVTESKGAVSGDLSVEPTAKVDFQSAMELGIKEGNQHVVKNRAQPLDLQQIRQAFQGKLDKNGLSTAYRIQLTLVAIAMALLPLLYVAFVLCSAFAVYYYAVNVIPGLLAGGVRGRFLIVWGAIVIAPAIAGCIMILFLVKPFFSRFRDEGRRRSLTRKGEPLLFELVDCICEATGAPVPQRIDVDYQVNASAKPERGVWSAASGRMVLTIGVPLITSLSATQLTGILAHEFGHFSQRLGMTATLIINNVNLWFTRLVYQRDQFDHALDNLIEDSDTWIGLILQLGKVCVTASRAVFYVFMVVGNALCASLLRQMEYDADRYEVGLVGSGNFASTSRALRELSIAQQITIPIVQRMALNRHLPDNLFLLLQQTRRQLPDDAVRGMLKAMQEPSGLFATHPTDGQRIARAEAMKVDGVFSMQRPASDLMVHFEGLCRNVTIDFYRDMFGTHIREELLFPTKEFLRKTEGQ